MIGGLSLCVQGFNTHHSSSVTLIPSRFSPFFILVKINQGNTKEDCRSEKSDYDEG